MSELATGSRSNESGLFVEFYAVSQLYDFRAWLLKWLVSVYLKKRRRKRRGGEKTGKKSLD